MGLSDFGTVDPWDEPSEEDRDAVDETLLTNLVMRQFALRPVAATTQFAQIRDVVRWYLAFETDGWETRRRRFAQRRVAEEGGVTYAAVQDKVRAIYDGRYGRDSAQELFEDDLAAIEDAYEAHCRTR